MATQLTDEQLRELYARAVAARRDPTRAACPTPDALLAAVGREGPEQRRLATLDHALGCADCRQELELLRAIETSRRNSAGTVVRGRRWMAPRYLLLAASIVLLAAIAVWQRVDRASPAEVFRGSAAGVAVIAPLPDATIANDSLTFAWHPVPGARRYAVEVTTSHDSISVTRETADTTISLGERSLPAGDYSWWVRAQLDGGESRSTVRRFHVQR